MRKSLPACATKENNPIQAGHFALSILTPHRADPSRHTAERRAHFPRTHARYRNTQRNGLTEATRVQLGE